MEQRTFEIKNLETRSDSDELIVAGKFVAYGDIYQVWDGATESIAPGAFRNSISQDVRALYNHNDDIVLGRVSAGTLSLEDRADGLWGTIKINRNDSDAMNAYERIKRGDVTGCSFGFNIKSEETEYREDGSVHWTITEVDPLYEVSAVTFPAYEATHIAARGKDLDDMKARRLELRKQELRKKLERTQDGSESINAEETD